LPLILLLTWPVASSCAPCWKLPRTFSSTNHARAAAAPGPPSSADSIMTWNGPCNAWSRASRRAFCWCALRCASAAQPTHRSTSQHAFAAHRRTSMHPARFAPQERPRMHKCALTRAQPSNLADAGQPHAGQSCYAPPLTHPHLHLTPPHAPSPPLHTPSPPLTRPHRAQAGQPTQPQHLAELLIGGGCRAVRLVQHQQARLALQRWQRRGKCMKRWQCC